jgi:hypothetical protein
VPFGAFGVFEKCLQSGQDRTAGATLNRPIIT